MGVSVFDVPDENPLLELAQLLAQLPDKLDGCLVDPYPDAGDAVAAALPNKPAPMEVGSFPLGVLSSNGNAIWVLLVDGDGPSVERGAEVVPFDEGGI